MSPTVERQVATYDPAMTIAKLQSEFAAALLQSQSAIPAAVSSVTQVQRVKRFNVYRNNVYASLATTLSARFPVVERLVGCEFFRAMAVEFIEQHPPTSPVIAEYGANLPAFVEEFEPASALPYLGDVARLEWARNIAYHAADAEPADIAALAAVDADKVAETKLVLHPAAAVVTSPYPIFSIWQTNTHDEVVRPITTAMAGETALVSRPRLDVLVTLLPAGAGALLQHLAVGATFATAAAGAAGQSAEIDLPLALSILFGAGAIASVNPPGT